MCSSPSACGMADDLGDPGVVHDLGNLIQIAASALSLVGRSPWTARDPSLEPALARATRALAQAGAVVRHTIARSREPTVTIRRTPEWENPADSLRELQALIEWVCEPDVRLSIDLPADLPPVLCNRIELQNAVLNLVINARDALSRGGRLSLSARAVGVGGSARAVDVRVSDDGVGMSPETLRRAYFTTKAGDRGAGLGLAMVRRFAQDAGGEVDMASTLGVGTTVTIRLPAAPWAAQAHPSDVAAGAEQSSGGSHE